MNPVVHFEMPYEDAERVIGFYAKAFGWQGQALGSEMADYVVATTTETANGRPTRPGTINGGFFRKEAGSPAQHPAVVIAVEDIAEAMARVVAAGGTVLGEPMTIPGIGRYVSIIDSEGNRVSVLQPLPCPPAAGRDEDAT